ncbi:hypothetical protein B6D60_10430 [candidate division KSB1 bacterium 4484_87]|nr:MAG: hypothetical protein B6D60_10430 [candidate division KSB1 bacterium 4484_87]
MPEGCFIDNGVKITITTFSTTERDVQVDSEFFHYFYYWAFVSGLWALVRDKISLQNPEPVI